MTKDQFIKWAQGRGWQLDRFGHLKKTGEGGRKLYRFKLSRVAVRYEVQLPSTTRSFGFDRDGKLTTTNTWVRLRSGYFSKLTISEAGRLKGMVR